MKEEKNDFKKMLIGHFGYTFTLVLSICLLLYLDKTVPAPNLFVGFFALICLIALIIYPLLSAYVFYRVLEYMFIRNTKLESKK